MLLNERIRNGLDTSYPFFEEDARAVEVLSVMKEGRLVCAPVLREGHVTAMVTLRELVGSAQLPKKSDLRLRELRLEKTAGIGINEHLFEVFGRIRLFTEEQIPVSDIDGRYVGVIEKSLLLENVAELYHLDSEGITLEMEVPAFRLKLSEVISAFEKNDATVLSFGIYQSAPESESMVVVFRVQTHDPFRLVKNIEKYGYTIRYSSPAAREGEDELREKALEFIRMMDL